MQITKEFLEARRAELLKSQYKLRADAEATEGALQLCAFLIDKCAEPEAETAVPPAIAPEDLRPQLVTKDAPSKR